MGISKVRRVQFESSYTLLEDIEEICSRNIIKSYNKNEIIIPLPENDGNLINRYEIFFPNKDLLYIIEKDPDLFYELEKEGELNIVSYTYREKGRYYTKARKEQIKKLISVLNKISHKKEIIQ